jgi:hypothetical protein
MRPAKLTLVRQPNRHKKADAAEGDRERNRHDSMIAVLGPMSPGNARRSGTGAAPLRGGSQAGPTVSVHAPPGDRQSLCWANTWFLGGRPPQHP